MAVQSLDVKSLVKSKSEHLEYCVKGLQVQYMGYTPVF